MEPMRNLLKSVELKTVEQIIKDGKQCVFEYNDETYMLSAIHDGVPLFTILGSLDIIEPPFSLNDKVKRAF